MLGFRIGFRDWGLGFWDPVAAIAAIGNGKHE